MSTPKQYSGSSGFYVALILLVILGGFIAFILHGADSSIKDQRATMERIVSRDYPGAEVVSVKTSRLASVNFDGDLKVCQIQDDAVKSCEGGLPRR